MLFRLLLSPFLLAARLLLLPFAFVVEDTWADRVFGAYQLGLNTLFAAIVVLNVDAWGLADCGFENRETKTDVAVVLYELGLLL